jgi:protein-tyrosine-phosphatase
MNILFLCKGNVGRSQMAEALFRQKFGDKHTVVSAGVKLSGPEQPIGELMPAIKETLDVMNEEGIDVSQAIRKNLTPEMLDAADSIIVILEPEEGQIDFLVGSPKLTYWSIPDPKGKDLDTTREIKNKIKEKINSLNI